MRVEIDSRYGSGRALRVACLIGAMAIAAACTTGKPTDTNQRSVTEQPLKIDEVDVRVIKDGLIVQYRTQTSIGDCKAQAAEMPKVWNLVVNERLKNSSPQWVHLVPEDNSGRSVGVEFTKSTSGEWASSAPCSIRIPAA